MSDSDNSYESPAFQADRSSCCMLHRKQRFACMRLRKLIPFGLLKDMISLESKRAKHVTQAT